MKSTLKHMLKLATAGLVLASGLSGCGALGVATAPKVNADTVELVRRGPGATPRFLAKNVLFRLDKDVAMALEEMNADMVLKDPTMPLVPANKSDYSLQIHYAKVHKGAASLEALMNKYIFNDADTPIKDVKLAFKGDKIAMTGKMKKGLWVGFEMEGTLGPTQDGRILMTPTSIKSMGMRVDGLMSLIGLEMAKLLKMKEEKGLVMAGNTIIMDPAKMYPPPTLMGRVTAVSVANNQLNIEFNDGKAKPWPEVLVKDARAMLLMWGGDILINKNLVLDAKMQILDATPATPMVYALDFYREQLEAGYTVATRDGYMITYGPDINQWGANLGRFTPPTFPVPGVPDLPSDMNAGAAEQPSAPAPQTRNR